MAEEHNQPHPKAETSILDRVLSSQHAAAIEGFVPGETFSALMKTLSDKDRDVLGRRFGLITDSPETLEEIGRKYNVTRERIRQIENSAVQKIRTSKIFHESLSPVDRLLVSILNTHGGMMEEQAFFQEALSHAGNSPKEQRALVFLLTELLGQKFEHLPADKNFRAAWKLRAQSLDHLKSSAQTFVDIITHHGSPIVRAEILTKFRERPIYREHSTWFTDEVVLSYLSLSAQIARNPFGEFGLTSWGTIIPKRMNDKIYLILKKYGQPLHFTEITKRINEAGFDHRRAYPPTVHNELILNNQYVLVGRGIYALKEWGYKPGVVADVLIDVLKKADRPMKRDELVQAVLEQRLVKRNTVLLALTNKRHFQRLSNGDYALAQHL